MKVVILCGGQGTRIRDVNEHLPKPMLPIMNKPILWHIMKYYAHYGHKEFILCLGYKGEVIRNFFLNYEANICDLEVTLGSNGGVKYFNNHQEDGWSVVLAETGQDSMTGARLKKIKKYIGDDENFMLTYGDGVGDINLSSLINFHQAQKQILTVTGVRPPGRFGELMQEDGIVTEFNEKPQSNEGRISGGFFVCNKKIFDYLDDREDLTLELEPMKSLVSDRKMAMFGHDGFWQPMDTYRDYMLLNKLAVSGNAPWIKW